MNNQTGRIHKVSETEENNRISSHADAPPPSNLEDPVITARKRSYTLHQTPSSDSPTKKICTSSIRTGLEKTEAAVGKQEAAPGLFQYFRRATDKERKEYLAWMDEEIETHQEIENFYSQKEELKRKTRIRNQNRERKRLQRIRVKNLEIKSGLRSAGGTKHQVRLTNSTFYLLLNISSM